MRCNLGHLSRPNNLLLVVLSVVLTFYILPTLLNTIRSAQQQPAISSLRTAEKPVAENVRQQVKEPAVQQNARGRVWSLRRDIDGDKRSTVDSEWHNGNRTMRELNGILSHTPVHEVADHDSRQAPSSKETPLDGFQKIMHFSQNQDSKMEPQMRSVKLDSEQVQRARHRYGWTGWSKTDDKCKLLLSILF